MRKSLLFLLIATFAAPLLAAVKGTVMNMNGAPLSGARVEAYQPETSEARAERHRAENPRRPAIALATTDAAGNFSLDVKKQPAVDVAVEAAEHEPIVVSLGGDDDAGAIALRPAASVAGIITAAGKPVANARVILSSGSAEYFSTTDAEGRYTAPDPNIWARQMVIHHPDFAPSTARMMGRKFSLNQQLTSGIAVSGRVLSEDGKQSVAGAKITAAGRETISAEDGTFTLLRLAEPRPAIRASIGDRIALDNSKGVSINLRLSRAGSITGVVRDAATQKPLHGARVSLGPAETGETVLTNSSGTFTLANVAPGRHRIFAVYPNYSFSAVEADMRAGEKVTRTLAGTQNATVTGTVSDETKTVVPAALLSVVPFDEPRGMRPASPSPAYSAPDGRFVLRNVPPDQSIEIVARKKGVPSGSAGPLRLTSGQVRKGVGIVLPRGITLTGKVTDRDGRPISGVSVIPREAQAGPGGMQRFMILGGSDAARETHVETGRDGSFALQLKEGRYDLLFRRDGYASRMIRSHAVTAAADPLEVSLEPGAEISGRVVRADGTGVPDVNINVTGSVQTESERTGPDGSFTISNLSPGTVTIVAMKAEEFIREMRSVTAPASDLLIQLPPGGRLEGRVIEKSTGRPVNRFRAGPSGNVMGGGMRFVGPSMLRNFDSGDGSFVLENVPPGKIELMVEAPGFVDARVPGLLVEEGKTISGIEVALETGVRLVGKVTGPDGSPLAGASVLSEEERSPAIMIMPDRTMTDGAGEYAIEAVEPAEKTFIFQKDGFLTERKTVKLSGREVRLDVRLSRGRDVTGTVIDENGVPVEGAGVTARSAIQDSGWRTTRTDSSGAFRLDGLAPGRYTFRAEKPGYVAGEARDIDLEAALAGVRISLKGGGTIVGTVRGLRPEDYNTVMVMATSAAGRASASGRVDSGGRFRLEGVPTGSVRVSASAGDFTSRKITPPQTVEVAAGSEVQVDLEFKSDVVIRGRVSRQGRPLDNAMVVFNPLDARVTTRSSTRTGASGSYELSGLEPGRYEVGVIDMQRFSSFDTSYEVVGSATFDIEIRGSEIRGRVVDAGTGAPIADATVTLQKATAEPSFLTNLNAATDSAGNFLFESVSAGSYRARAQKERYGQTVVDITVSDSGTREIELKLTRHDGVRLRVVDRRDGRALLPMVWIRDQQGRSAFEGSPRPNSDGVLVIPLGSGAYRAHIGAPGYAMQSISLIVPSQEMRVALTPGGAIAIQSRHSTRELAKLMTPAGDFFQRSPWSQPQMVLEPGTTMLENLAPGPYVLHLLDDRGNVKDTYSVTVVEGQTARVEI